MGDLIARVRWDENDQRRTAFDWHATTPTDDADCWDSFDGVIVGVDGWIEPRSSRRDGPKSEEKLLATRSKRRGWSAFRELTGAFSAVVWDPDAMRLLAARDRTGQRSLYVGHRDGETVVASRMDDVATSAAVEGDVSETVLAGYLANRLPTDGRTFFTGVRRIRPGELVEVTPSGVEFQRYGDLSDGPDAIIESPTEALRRRIEYAVRRRSEGPRQTGVLMSGGLDSTTVAAILAQQSNDSPRAYSVLFDDQSVDEQTGVDAVEEATSVDVRRLSGNGRELPLRTSTGGEPPCDHPVLDSSLGTVATGATAASAEGRSVLLTGVGGNLHDGTRLVYADLLRRGKLESALTVAKRDSQPLTRTLVTFGLGPLVLGERAYRRTRQSLPAFVSTDCVPSVGNGEETDGPITSEFLYRSVQDPYMDYADEVSRRIGATAGVSQRSPLLDSRVVTTLFGLSAGSLFDGRYKSTFRDIAREYLPTAVTEQPVHANDYNTILRRRLRCNRSQWQPYLSDMRLASRGLVDEAEVQAVARSVIESTESPSASVEDFWRVVTAERWLRKRRSE